MKSLILLCTVLIQCSWSYGSPGPESSRAFAYVDNAGNRYECVYKPQYNLGVNSPESSRLNKYNEVKPVDTFREFKRFLPPFRPLPSLRPFGLSPMFHWFPPLPPLKPLPPLALRDIFNNIENQQRAAFEAAQSSFGAFNAFPFIPNYDFRFPFYDNFKFGSRGQRPYDMSGTNSAFAAGAVGPGFRHQIASIDPANPRMPNVDTSSKYPHNNNRPGNDFYSVSSSSFSSSVNDNGELKSQRGAETVVNDRGHITKYSVHS